jgi:Guanylate-binding protein, N-terminal domain
MEEAEGKPLLLIEIVDDPTDKRMPHKLRLNAQAVAALAGSTDRYVRAAHQVAPVTVCGPYRSGKSFLLNQLIQKLNGFEVGSTTRACTKGVWIWSSPLDLQLKVGDELVPTDMYFLDCEGTSSLERNASIDSLLLTISVFLSSVLIYNT